MADVAAVAKVHQTTVSLALRNHPSIPPATRARIRKAAAQIGYRPDPLLDAFNLHRLASHPVRSAASIAYLTDLPSRSLFDASAKHTDLYLGAKLRAESLGLRLERFFVGPRQLPVSRVSQILESRNIHAVLVAAFSPETTVLPLRWAQLCGLKIESFHVRPQFDAVLPDHIQATRLAMTQLRKLGHQRIGLVLTHEEDDRLENLHLIGYLLEETQGLPPFFLDDWSHGEAPSRLARWAVQNKIEVIVSNIETVPEVLTRCRAPLANSIPVVSLDVRRPDSQAPGIVVDYRAVGERAAELLATRMQGHERGLPLTPAMSTVPVSWLSGERLLLPAGL